MSHCPSPKLSEICLLKSFVFSLELFEFTRKILYCLVLSFFVLFCRDFSSTTLDYCSLNLNKCLSTFRYSTSKCKVEKKWSFSTSDSHRFRSAFSKGIKGARVILFSLQQERCLRKKNPGGKLFTSFSEGKFDLTVSSGFGKSVQLDKNHLRQLI